MAKIKIEFDGELQYLELGIRSLARSMGWVPGSEEDPILYAKAALAQLTREKVFFYQEADADAETQIPVDAALAAKAQTMAAVREGTTAALDAVTLTVEVINE